MFSQRFVGLTALVCAAAFVPFLIANADEDESIAFSKLPAAVQKAAREAFPGAKIGKCEKEREHGRVQYEVKLTVGGREVEVEMDAHGNVLEQEEQLSVAQMPYGIVSRIKGLVPGGQIKEACKKVKGGQALYEVDVATRQAKLELTFDHSGKLLRIKPEDDDGEHEESSGHHGRGERRGHDDDDD